MPFDAFMEGQRQTNRDDDEKTDDPKDQGNAGRGFQTNSVEFGKYKHCNDLHAASDARDLNHAAKTDESQDDNDIRKSEASSRGKGAEYAIKTAHDDHPFEQTVEHQKRSKRRTSRTFHALFEGAEEFRDPSLHMLRQEREGIQKALLHAATELA
jgi:hypothetical protein